MCFLSTYRNVNSGKIYTCIYLYPSPTSHGEKNRHILLRCRAPMEFHKINTEPTRLLTFAVDVMLQLKITGICDREHSGSSHSREKNHSILVKIQSSSWGIWDVKLIWPRFDHGYWVWPSVSVIQTWTGNQSTDVGQYHTDSTQSITMASYSWELRASLLRREGVESGRKP